MDSRCRSSTKSQRTTGRDLERAIAKGELCLQFQPKLDLISGVMAGAEALVRWQSPVRGLLHPVDLIPAAESNDIIGRLGYWAVRSACAQLARWREMEAGVQSIAVNVSTMELDDPEYVERVLDCVHSSGIRAWQLTLEITQSMTLDQPFRLTQLQALAEAGVRVSLDDFGTGCSSLLHLRRLPISELKIDRSFVQGILHDRHDAAIVNALVTLAESLGVLAVAEGVETVQQQAALAEMGCPQIQGILISPPVDAEGLIRVAMDLQQRSTLANAALFSEPINPAR